MDLTTALLLGLPSMAICDEEEGFGLGLLDDDDGHHTPPETKPTPSHPLQLLGFDIPQKPHISSSLAAASNFSLNAKDDTVDSKSQHAVATKAMVGVKEEEEEPDDVGQYFFDFNSGVSSYSDAGFLDNKERWSWEEIRSLLDAYIERREQLYLDRRNFRNRDWEAIAAAMTKQHPAQDGGSSKSLVQCKNKIYSLKKLYEGECWKIACRGKVSSTWPWFNKMELIFGTASARSIAASKPAYSTGDEKPRLQQQQNNESYAGVGSRLTPLLNPRWKRAVLKIGGSLLTGASSENVDPKIIMLIAQEVQVARLHGVQVAILVGSRNIYCGDAWAAATGISRAATYPIGCIPAPMWFCHCLGEPNQLVQRMMASVMNAKLLQTSLEKIGIEARVQTSLTMQDATEPYTRERAIRHLEKGRVVIFGGICTSMENLLFTTDTTAALRASEINAGVLLKGLTGDRLNSCPHASNGNEASEHISYKELEARGVSNMDVTAITFCEENNMPVVLFNMLEPGNISRALCGDKVGTLVDQTGTVSQLNATDEMKASMPE